MTSLSRNTHWTLRTIAIPTVLLMMVGVAGAQQWSTPVTLVDGHGRLAVGNRLHVVGRTAGNVVHRSSQDDGATWSVPSVVTPIAGNVPMQYGGLWTVGNSVYLVTAQGDMGPASQHLDFRRSTNNGETWTSPIQITGPGQQIRRANIAVSGANVHVFGGQSGPGGYGTGIYYFRSLNGGANWDPGVLLYVNADASARMAVDGSIIHVAFGDKLAPNTFGGVTSYMRSTDNGTTWSNPVYIGDAGRHARQQIVAADGNVFVMWQREALVQGNPLPADRLGYNRSLDGGLTWLGPQLLPEDSGVNREHHQIWITPGGGLHVTWSHGNPSDPASSTGYVSSPDYGATWLPREIALDTPGGNNPHNIVAEEAWVHIIAEPNAGIYVRRAVSTPVPVASSFCAANANSTAAAGVIGAQNIDLVARTMELTGSNLPLHSFAFSIASLEQDFVANPGGSWGNICLGGTVGRAVGGNILNTGVTGTLLEAIDLNSIPQPGGAVVVQGSEAWNFQYWHRDVIAGLNVTTSNFTNGVRVWFP